MKMINSNGIAWYKEYQVQLRLVRFSVFNPGQCVVILRSNIAPYLRRRSIRRASPPVKVSGGVITLPPFRGCVAGACLRRDACERGARARSLKFSWVTNGVGIYSVTRVTVGLRLGWVDFVLDVPLSALFYSAVAKVVGMAL